jgi:hypothetical protein
MTGCVEAASSDQRYPRVHRWGRTRYSHRVAYESAKGRIPPGLTVDHLCFNKRCINPAHLEAVTRAENTHRAQVRIGRLADGNRGPCVRGHIGLWRPSGRGYQCRECHRMAVAAWRSREALMGQ